MENRLIAHGNAVNNTARQLGGSIGTALLITIMTMAMMSNWHLGETQATLLGINAAFGASTLLTGLALILALFKVRDNKTQTVD